MLPQIPNAWALLGLAVTGLAFFAMNWIKAGQQQRTGATLEAAKVDQATAVAETAIAQAEVNAPTTKAALVDRLKAGTF